MPDIKRYKSVAVPIEIWVKLKSISATTHRSPAQQISFLVDLADELPSDIEAVRAVWRSNGIKRAHNGE